MTKTIKTVLATLTALALCAFSACSNLTISDSGKSHSSKKDAKITLSLGTTPRTILPEISLTGYTYTLTATNTSTSEKTTLLSSQTYADLTTANAVSIAAGSYAFTVTASNGSADILSGTTTKTVSSGSNTLSIKLAAVAGSTTGAVSVDFTYTSGAGVAAIYAYFGETMPTSTTYSEGTNLYSSSSEGTVAYEDSNVSAGNHYIAFYAYSSETISSDTLLGYTVESIYVVGGSTTSGTMNLKISKTVGVYPENNSTVPADTQLILTFTDTPTLVAGSTIKIYATTDTTNPVDTITINSTSADESQNAQSGYTVNVGNQQLVRVSGNSVYIQPHYNGTTSATLLQPSTSYYVEIPSTAITLPSGATLHGGETWAGFSGSSGWYFTTKAAPSLSTSITVSNNIAASPDYFSVYGAMWAVAQNGTSGTNYEIEIEPGTYYELVSIKSNGANVILKGTGTESYGADTIIEYVNNQYLNSSSQAYRPTFYFNGANLTLENVKLANLTARETSYSYSGSYGSDYQAETLMFVSGDGKTVNAYNSTFTSLQDTIYTTGKAWFYGCYIAGDVDFMWGQSQVALFENCYINCVKEKKSDAYIFESRIGKNSSAYPTLVGKGYVLYNSTVSVDSGVTAYYARRATSVSSAESNNAYYYDQAALVNVDFTGSGSLASAHWYVGNTPNGVTDGLYGSYADVGWKEYGVTQDSTAVSTSGSSYGVITSAEYSAEYSGRRAILNRFYNITGKAYERDTDTNFAVDKLISSRGYNVTSDLSAEVGASETTYTTTTWDFSSSDFTSSTTSYNGITLTDTGYDTKGYCTGGNNSSISIPVTGACSLTVYYCYAAAGTISATNDSTDASVSFSTSSNSTSTIESKTFNYTLSSSGTIVVSTTGKTYFVKIVLSYANSSGITLTLSGDTTVDVDSDVIVQATADSATTGSWAWVLDSNTAYVTLTHNSTDDDSTTSSVTVTGKSAGTAKIYAVVDGVVSSAWSVTVGATNYIQASDTPTGWASVDATSAFGNYSSYKVKTVTNKAEFVQYATAGGYLIYVNGTIDLSGGMLPSTYDGTTSTLDEWIATKTSNTYTSYDAWKVAYAKACSATTNDKTSSSPESTLGTTLWVMENAYKEIVQVNIASNTMIIGMNDSAIIKGGCLMINGKSNVALRNLTIQDAYDPFPHHEKNDGFNAQYDCITIQGTCDHIWIDHCTIQDTMKDHVYVTLSDQTTTEKWQTYDGLCDMKGALTYATVSYCKFSSHDKTMLIGSDDTESFSGTRTVTLHHNYFSDCVQRLPMVRLTNIHIFNNYYDFSSYSAIKKTLAYNDATSSTSTTETITNGYGIGVRCNSNIISERNYFASGMKYAYSGNSATASVGSTKANCVSTTLIYINGDLNNSTNTANNSSYYTVTDSMPWTPSASYDYTLDATSDLSDTVVNNAGAGKWAVKK